MIGGTVETVETYVDDINEVRGSSPSEGGHFESIKLVKKTFTGKNRISYKDSLAKTANLTKSTR